MLRSGEGIAKGKILHKKTPADYHVLAENNEYIWLGPEVLNTHIKTNWRCSKEHKWSSRYHDISQGYGCPKCAIKRRAKKRSNKPAAYHVLAKKRGFHWLGPEVPNSQTLTTWECERKHQWKARYSNILAGNGCPICSNRVPKTAIDYHSLAKKRGFHWLGPEVSNIRIRTKWQCQKGHQWETAYGNIQSGKGCPHCYGNVPKTPIDYHVLAETRGFHWLGPEVPNIKTETNWECQEGHHWESRFNDIQQGYGCPHCAGLAPKTPIDYHALAKKCGFHWLGPETSNIRIRTRWECQEGHIWETPYGSIRGGTGCPYCYGNVPKTPEDYYELGKERGFRWLGSEILNTHTKTEWECPKGHIWEAVYGSIQQGSGCPICAGNLPLTPIDYHSLAQERGFQWLGPKVSNAVTKTTWKCKKGHVWETRFNDIQQGCGCPICLDIVNGSKVSKPQRQLCEILNGELNKPFGLYCIDITLCINDINIAVEYDSWFWHANKQKHDAKRDERMIEGGYRVLRVKSNNLLPSIQQLDKAISELIAGANYKEIVLEDWGTGATWGEIRQMIQETY